MTNINYDLADAIFDRDYITLQNILDSNPGILLTQKITANNTPRLLKLLSSDFPDFEVITMLIKASPEILNIKSLHSDVAAPIQALLSSYLTSAYLKQQAYPEIIKLALDLNPKSFNDLTESDILNIVKYDNLNVMKFMLEKDPNILTKMYGNHGDYWSIAHQSAENKFDGTKIIDFITTMHPEFLSKTSSTGVAPILTAIMKGNINVVKYILEKMPEAYYTKVEGYDGCFFANTVRFLANKEEAHKELEKLFCSEESKALYSFNSISQEAELSLEDDKPLQQDEQPLSAIGEL